MEATGGDRAAGSHGGVAAVNGGGRAGRIRKVITALTTFMDTTKKEVDSKDYVFARNRSIDFSR